MWRRTLLAVLVLSIFPKAISGQLINPKRRSQDPLIDAGDQFAERWNRWALIVKHLSPYSIGYKEEVQRLYRSEKVQKAYDRLLREIEK